MQKTFFVLLFAAIYTLSFNAKAEATQGLTTGFSSGTRGIVIHQEQQSPETVIAFWTDDNMRKAWTTEGKVPAPPPQDEVITPGGDQSGYALMPIPYQDHRLSRVTGILFFRVPNDAKEELKHCTASVITSESKSIVLTAAHCFRQGGQWHDMLMFVPAYRQLQDGSLDVPLEKWPVYAAFLPYEGAEQTQDDDIAVARVYAKPEAAGQMPTLEQLVGSGLQPRVTEDGYFPSVEIIGYPAQWMIGDKPYEVAEQRRCMSYTDKNPFSATALRLLNCAPQGGNSGGPVIDLNINPAPDMVVAVFSAMPGISARLLPHTFPPIYDAADSAVLP
jgi:hypothetical protein